MSRQIGPARPASLDSADAPVSAAERAAAFIAAAGGPGAPDEAAEDAARTRGAWMTALPELKHPGAQLGPRQFAASERVAVQVCYQNTRIAAL